ncbi:hypothetical protein [Rhodopila sp.]|uniref:tetratricopeptide repeat protein n=1 Tax=Rhodopila sp. TaxID=2480087 RepID=UPI003D0E0A45
MTMAIRCAVLALCALLVTSLPANAGGNSFADLLARAKAQDAAGHRWAPPGDNVTETVMTMLDTISTATPDQLAELSALLQRDKPPADPLAPDRQTENMPADTATFATPPLAMPPLTSSPPTPSPTAPPQDMPGLAATPAPSGATESVSPPIADQPTPTPNPTLATAEPPATPLPDQSANQPSNDGQNSSATPNSATPNSATPSSATPSPANSSQAPSGPAAPSPIADTITPSKIAPDPLTPTQAAPTPIEPAQTTDDPQRAAMLFARGLDAERRGDISGARRFYATSARQGDATAALNLGRLYDPAYLKQTTLGGVDPDPELARFWYATAARLGDTGAAPLLEALSSR